MTTNATSLESWLRLMELSATTKIKYVKTVVVLAIANTTVRSRGISLLTSSAEFAAVPATWLGIVPQIRIQVL